MGKREIMANRDVIISAAVDSWRSTLSVTALNALSDRDICALTTSVISKIDDYELDRRKRGGSLSFTNDMSPEEREKKIKQIISDMENKK